jgi:flagellar biosynthetic protein FlhB
VADNEERTEQATARRRDEARKDGRVARSADMTTALGLMTALIALSWFGPDLARAIRQMIAGFLGLRLDMPLTAANLQEISFTLLGPVFLALAPMVFLLMASAILVSILQVGWQLTPELLAPKWERLNFLAGITRLFSVGSVGTLVAGLLKLAAVGLIAYKYIAERSDTFPQLHYLDYTEYLGHMGALILGMGWRIVTAMLVIGGLDYGFQKWRFERSIRMTKQEIKEEHKQNEGDPQIKARVRQIQRQMVFKRMMQAVPKATVVVTNPTHVAVALRYEPGADAAPKVLAMGPNLIALRIRKLAEFHGIPIHEDPPLARALLRSSTIGKEIPPQFYRAVAQVLAFIMRKKKAYPQMPAVAAAGGN